MDFDESNIDVDPDYARNNTALRKVIKKEQEENKLNTDQISNTIRNEFDKELVIRQKQCDEIEEHITKAQKLLHILRYALITSYYNKKSLEFTSTSDETANKVFDGQNRIHPAVKKLLGKNANLDIFSSLGKRKAVLKNCDNSEPSTSQAGPCKKRKIGNESDQLNFTPLDNNQNCLKNRKKIQHRLIIGNISKYAPSFEDDNLTHKWMVYVRGERNKPDISHVVEKVRFYLHPSYKPNDVVEVGTSPFHLSRRGWGEFPLRVHIVFKCKLNKPIEVVHDLKLDKTCSGRQMLGNETLVDVYLHEDTTSLAKPEATITHSQSSEENLMETITIDHNAFHEELSIKEEPMDNFENIDLSLSEPTNYETLFTPLELSTDIANQEHDYCQEEIVEELVENTVAVNRELVDQGLVSSSSETDHFQFDHSYCIPFSDQNKLILNSSVEETKIVRFEVMQEEDNQLRFGLDESYSNSSGKKIDKKIVPSVAKTRPITLNHPIKILLPINSGKTILTNGHLVTTGPSTHWMTTTAPVVLKSRYMIRLPVEKFKNMGEVLPYILKRVPLWSERARDVDFKRSFPFMACSKEEYEGWNFGKRINSEWGRARTVRKTLETNSFPESKKWTTKTFFMYARSHMYSPVVSFKLFLKSSRELHLLNSCFSTSYQNYKKEREKINHDVNIDVESENDHTNSSSQSQVIDISDPALKSRCAYVKEAALDCGIVLKSTEITEGVIFNGAERMILEAVKCLAEGLIRRGHHHMASSRDYKVGVSEINAGDIQRAINERGEMQLIKNFKRRRQEMFFFS